MANGVHHGASNKLKPLNSAPQQNTTDSSTHAVPTESDTNADTDSDHSENANVDTSKQQPQVCSIITTLLFVYNLTISHACTLLFNILFLVMLFCLGCLRSP